MIYSKMNFCELLAKKEKEANMNDEKELDTNTDEEDCGYTPQKAKKGFSFGKLLKSIGLLLIAAVYVMLIGRMLLARPVGVMKTYLWTDKSAEYYNASPDTFKPMKQQLEEIIDDDGYYHISKLAYIEDIGEFQITVRYNNSTLERLDEYYSDRVDAGECFVFTLTDDSGKLYDTYKYASSENFIYNFRRLVFENVDISSADKLYLNIFYSNDISSSSPMFVSFKVYDSEVSEIKSEVKCPKDTASSAKLYDSPSFMIKD